MLLSIRVSRDNVKKAQEALKRAKFKFPGRQKIFVSRKFGFTNLLKSDFYKLEKNQRIIEDGSNAKIIGEKGPLNRLPFMTHFGRNWEALPIESLPVQ